MAWLHGWSGLLLGWLLFAITLTGTASVFKSEIEDWTRPEIRNSGDPAHAVAAVAAYLSSNAPGSSGWYITPPDERVRAVIATYELKKRDGTSEWPRRAFDPVTGRPDGIRDTLGGEFFYRFHFELQLPYPWGRMLASAAAMLMLIALLSGIITHRRIFADFFTFRAGKGKRSWLDAHNVMGVLAMPFHLMITFTGIVTLLTLTLPWGMVAAYGSDSAAFEEDMFPGHVDREATGTPAPLTDLGPVMRDAQRRFGGGRIGRVDVEHPGDKGAIITIARHDGDQLSYSASHLSYDGVTGRLLWQGVEQRPAKTSYNVLYGLHIGRFAAQVSRWLYFLCGLALAGTIASGMVLWSVSRAERRTPGHVVVERLTTGAIGGLPLAMAGFFWANRLIPADMAERAALEVRCFFLLWLATVLAGLAVRPRVGWPLLMAVTALAWGLLPILSFATTGYWVMPGFDLVCLAAAAVAVIIARGVRNAPQRVKTRRLRTA